MVSHIEQINAPPNTPRQYAAGHSKHTMKDSRYTANGMIHRNGIGAMSCVSFAVDDTSATDAKAGNKNHRSRSDRGILMRSIDAALSRRACEGVIASPLTVSDVCLTAEQPHIAAHRTTPAGEAHDGRRLA